MITVARFANPPEAYFFQALLASEEIEGNIIGAESMSYLPGGGAMNAIRIEVDDADYGRARELLVEWEASRVEAVVEAEQVDETLQWPPPAILLRWLVLIYFAAVVPLGCFNRWAAPRPSPDQFHHIYGNGMTSHQQWSLSYHGYPGYLICSMIAATMIFCFHRWGRPLFLGTLVWWVLASLIGIGGRRTVVSWPAKIVCFGQGLAIAILIYRRVIDPWFYPELRRELGRNQKEDNSIAPPSLEP